MDGKRYTVQTATNRISEWLYKQQINRLFKMLLEINIIKAIHQEDTKFVNTYIPNNRTSKYIKKISSEIKIFNLTLTVGDFNTTLLI